MAKIATLITDKFEDSEYTSPKEALEAAGHTIINIDKEGNKVNLQSVGVFLIPH
ncbi:hypothetical protein [Metasolibacillus meyeri]|uniref:hypothetical protein n=1 Tax=Metasolibacillus meyeri TaxID=1071052 RepID=UPI003B75D283